MSDDRAIALVIEGATWSDFCDGLKAAGAGVLREASPRDPLDRAEGFRYLTRLVRTALEQQLEFADPAAPVFRRPSHETVKIGADNPDNHYQSAAISGAYEYVIRGKRKLGALPRHRHLRGRLVYIEYLCSMPLYVTVQRHLHQVLRVSPQPIRALQTFIGP